jgi:hypothetical protein
MNVPNVLPYHSFLCVCFDHPNRAIRTRMLRGVGGARSDGRPYPYRQITIDILTEIHLQFKLLSSR